MLKTDLLTFGVTDIVFKIAGEMRRLPACTSVSNDCIMVLNQAQATRERPRTGSQNSGSSVPVAVAPPPGMVQHAAPQPALQPAPQPKPPSVDLLGDLGGDPFAQPQPQSKSE